jgi:hypothetical protein
LFPGLKIGNKKRLLKGRFFITILFTRPGLNGALDLAAPQTTGAHQNPFGAAVNNGSDALQVRQPGPLGADVRVTHLHPHRNTLAANDALSSHNIHLLFATTLF